MMLGFLLAAVGMDTVTGQLRMTFGSHEMIRGFDFLVAVIGLFGISEILSSIEDGLSFNGQKARIDLKVVLRTWAELPRHWVLAMRSAAIGCWMGITPAGATPASFMSYGVARRMSPRQVRQGADRGRDRAGDGGARGRHQRLLPMLTLGVPGSPTAAVLLGGLIMWGLQPGPMLFVEQKEFVWGLIASMYLGNVAGLIVVLVAVPWFAAILRVPFSIIAAMILVVCAIGAFTVSNAEFDIMLMLVFGVVGYV